MISGTVKYFNSERGFGLIRRADGERDIRVLFDAIRQAGVTRLEEGQKLTFELVTHPVTGKVTAGLLKLA